MIISITPRRIAGVVALILCYSASYFLFWDDQLKLNGFHIDPHQSLVTRFLAKSFSWELKREMTLLGIILAFVSVHLSWGCRHWLGDVLLKRYREHQQSKQPVESSVEQPMQQPAQTKEQGQASKTSQNDLIRLPGSDD